MEVIDFGLSRYRMEWDRQKRLHSEIIAKKKAKESYQEYILIGEHFPIYTIGRHGKIGNLLIGEDILSSKGFECIRIDRGGDITFHGPGQIILYPIIDLYRHSMGVKEYVSVLEESVIKLLEKYNIRGERREGATGVWIGKDTNGERKICAIGVKISHGVTMHGLALNVNTDLGGFALINPCGFIDKGVTSMAKEKNKDLDISLVKKELIEIFLNLMGE